jgi:hypothetical protein
MASQLGIANIVERKVSDREATKSYFESRKRHIDDTDNVTKLAELKRVSPWITQFTPTAAAHEISEPPRRPPSPFSGKGLRTKDLIPIDLRKESTAASSSSSTIKFICPVSRYVLPTVRPLIKRLLMSEIPLPTKGLY